MENCKYFEVNTVFAATRYSTNIEQTRGCKVNVFTVFNDDQIKKRLFLNDTTLYKSTYQSPRVRRVVTFPDNPDCA